jgi:hypothetical protein
MTLMVSRYESARFSFVRINQALYDCDKSPTFLHKILWTLGISVSQRKSKSSAISLELIPSKSIVNETNYIFVESVVGVR